ncbi:hypothetical protein Pan54_30530 [Rubinisphaera italica]|uniref:Uncharacterized protein n=1 Tax=Rubinisphaera italica TaxID=2527969 RepID=A0A5C5XKP6_9PLAN|nr:hypothetical protein Pan54_30530 [Rubinisphaera italica]
MSKTEPFHSFLNFSQQSQLCFEFTRVYSIPFDCSKFRSVLEEKLPARY